MITPLVADPEKEKLRAELQAAWGAVLIGVCPDNWHGSPVVTLAASIRDAYHRRRFTFLVLGFVLGWAVGHYL